MGSSAERGNNGGWQLDRHVPVAILLAIAIQTGGALWWASSMTTRVDQLERQITAVAPQSERIIRLETRLDAIQDSLRDIKTALGVPTRHGNP